jgi:cytochrome c553
MVQRFASILNRHVRSSVTASLASIVVLFAPHSSWAQTPMAADSAQCAMCHGVHGEGGAGGIPRLAGQNPAYLSHALSMFKSGKRVSPTMQAIAQGLSDTQMAQLADYFSKQSPPILAASEPPQLVSAGKQLAEMGEGNVAACFSCHAAQGKGNGARFPSIAGQPAQFVVDRLHEFQARARGKTPPPGSMTAIAATLNETQINEAAAYLSQLER